MPYRQSDNPPRYICIVCYRTVSSMEGTCPNCSSAPLQTIEGNDEIITKLRQLAKEKKDRPGKREFAFVIITAAVLAVLIHVLLIRFGAYDLPTQHGGGWGRQGPGGKLYVFIMVTFCALFLLLGYLTKWWHPFKSLPGADSFDPEGAPIPALLEWLDLRAGGAK